MEDINNISLPYFITNKIKPEILKNIPKVNLIEHFFTDYIDYINKYDFIKAKSDIIWGYDNYRRFFISIIFNKNYNDIDRTEVMTIFQKYTNDKYYWVSCQKTFNKRGVCNFNFKNCFNSEDNVFYMFFEIINNKIIFSLYDDMKVSYELLSQYNLKMKYILIIQRAFRERIQIPPNGWLVKKLMEETMRDLE